MPKLIDPHASCRLRRMTTPTNPNLREYHIGAQSTSVFGRVLVSARQHHFVIDGPVQNDCPGEAITPAESFLAGVAGCCVELMHVIARDQGAPLQHADVKIYGMIDRDRQERSDITLFNQVRISIALTGVTQAQGEEVVAGFRRRCPLYGTVAAATKAVSVELNVG
jgi:uncharacterized OsmC-like protein